MKRIYQKFQIEALDIACRHPAPDFYCRFESQVERSYHALICDPMTKQIYQYVVENIENDFGHGVDHARKVALDAGVLVLVDGADAGYPEETLAHMLRLAHCAGLLHDICRKEKKHARAGARAAEKVLDEHGFTEKEIADICLAIANHEAFGENSQSDTREGELLSNCLYDADKFRWGPENFTQTIWSMVSCMDVPVEVFMKHYPKGMGFLRNIRETFRTSTGRIHGPQFIDLGVSIGEALHVRIKEKYLPDS